MLSRPSCLIFVLANGPTIDRRLMKVSVIIPVYNERDTIATVISWVRQAKCAKEIVVVDDGSTDGTRDILERLAKEGDDPSFVCLFHLSNLGKGAAVRT